MLQFKHNICMPKTVLNEETHLYGFAPLFVRLEKNTDTDV